MNALCFNRFNFIEMNFFMGNELADNIASDDPVRYNINLGIILHLWYNQIIDKNIGKFIDHICVSVIEANWRYNRIRINKDIFNCFKLIEDTRFNCTSSN